MNGLVMVNNDRPHRAVMIITSARTTSSSAARARNALLAACGGVLYNLRRRLLRAHTACLAHQARPGRTGDMIE